MRLDELKAKAKFKLIDIDEIQEIDLVKKPTIDDSENKTKMIKDLIK